jgi:hypothetical protein
MNAPLISHSINFVYVGDNNVVTNVTGLPSYTAEQQGIDYLTSFYANEPEYNVPGGGWYLHNPLDVKRKNAGIGATYDPELDAFISICSFASWTLDAEIFQWIPPSPQPSVYHSWDEDTLSWVKTYPE